VSGRKRARLLERLLLAAALLAGSYWLSVLRMRPPLSDTPSSEPAGEPSGVAPGAATAKGARARSPRVKSMPTSRSRALPPSRSYTFDATAKFWNRTLELRALASKRAELG
jgi:hypothetical protein